MMDLALLFTIGGSIAGSTWWLSKQFKTLEDKLIDTEKTLSDDIDRLDDHFREYTIRNDHELEKQKNRITALKVNVQNSLMCLQSQVKDIENFLIKQQDFHKRSYWECSTDTQGDFEDDRDSWTELR